jgi:acetoin utilization deacetylase AcuC-like enzyme
LDCRDVAISPASFDAAVCAVAATVTLASAIAGNKVSNGFALVRPPGHHAERTNAMGFCLFNNIAITARYLQRHHGVDKIAIVDWDVHHGNGTQHAFYEDPSVLYVSLHQYPYYPGTGSIAETGSGKGAGATLNCPLPANSSDASYQKAFTELVLPRLNSFRPEFVLISAGFDAHRDDPLADMNLTTECFGWMTARLLEGAARFAGGKVLSLLEGGYDVGRLAECVALHIETLIGDI